MDDPKSNGLKFIFLGLLLTALFCLGMCGVTLRRTIAEIALGKTQDGRPSPFPGTASAAQWRVYAGKWSGRSTTQEGICDQTFELRPGTDAKAPFAGYLTLSCIPIAAKVNANPLAMLLQRSPRSAILRGSPSGAALVFSVETNVGGDEDCPMRSLKLLPFGASQLASEWADGCRGGQLLLSKVGQ